MLNSQHQNIGTYFPLWKTSLSLQNSSLSWTSPNLTSCSVSVSSSLLLPHIIRVLLSPQKSLFCLHSLPWWSYPISYLCCCSVIKSCLTLCNPMNPMKPGSTPGFPFLHCLLEFAQTHVCWVGDAIPSHPLSSPSPLALNLSQHQGLFQLVSSLHQVAKRLELQLQSFQWIFRVDFL